MAKLNPNITQGIRKKEDEFELNKDAGMYVCKACPWREGCYKVGAKSETYSVTIKSNEHTVQEAFQNSELKHRHGYDVASSAGLIGMQMQGAMAIFTVNLKRIMTLLKL